MTKPSLDENVMSWGGKRPLLLDEGLQLKLGEEDMAMHFQFFSTFKGKPYQGKSKMLELKITNWDGVEPKKVDPNKPKRVVVEPYVRKPIP